MSSRIVRAGALALLVLVMGGSALAATGGSTEPLADDGSGRTITGITDLVNHGTDWTPEIRNKFSLWRPYGWGTVARVKAAGVGNQWVHIPIPYPSRISDTFTSLEYVEFCAQSTNGAATKPIRIDLWDGSGTKFKSQAIAWPGDNARHCFGITFNPPEWHDALGVSVQLKFANTTDKITLFKAWARVRP